MPLASPNQGLKLKLLGGFDVCLNDRPVAGFSYNKMRALLAYLAVEREQDHNREVLAELLWSDITPIAARDNLRRTLSNLRRVLELPSGKVLFSATKHTIRFIPNIYVDALDFIGQECDKERVIALYRGEFLAGMSMPDSPDFEDWLHMQREIMQRRALALLEQLSNHHAQMSDYSKALQFALRLTELEPWDEDAQRRVMRLYALNGSSSAALVQYETCCRLLKKELDALPNEETRQLAEEIRNGNLRRRSPDTVAAPLPSIAPPPAERRQVSVLYCELSLATVDDPDDAMALLRAPQSRCVEIIRQFSGHIVQTHGGGLLAYFGYPQAYEFAARRAVQAALAVTHEAAHCIEIRAAVHTGLIITGGDSSMPDTVGKTSKLAIQLRHGAVHNEVVISPETRRIVDGYFDCTSLGMQPLPGLAQPVEIFKVVQESGARTRLEAAAQLTPLVGRNTEITRLMGLWKKTARGVSHVILVQGEAGIGKSRLLHTLKERLTDTPHTVRELHCFPEFSQSPFYPLIAMFEAIFCFVHGDTPELKSDKVEQYLEVYCPTTAQEAVPLITQLLSLPLAEHYQVPGVSPQKQKERTIGILLEMLRVLAAQQPVLFIVEDLHWVDPSTLELLKLLVAQKESGSVLAVFTARPEFIPPWSEAPESTLILASLVEGEAAKMLASISGDIPAATIHHIVERADGVPLFIEEMAKIATTGNQASIPATLHDLLAARMDNIGEAKYTAQLAATLGREFDLNLLRKVSPHDSATLTQTLNALQDAGLILRVKETVRQFKHALIQEAAYQSQAKAERQAAHQRIAQTLLADFSDVAINQPELVAQHLSAGGEIRQSIEYWIKAGQRAVQNSANAEAIEHFSNGLQQLMLLTPDKERNRLEFGLCINLGAALIATRGYGSVEVGQAYSRALELSESADDGSCLFTALWGMWLTSSSRVGHAHSLDLAEKLLRLAEQNNDLLQLLQALYAMGNSLLWTGKLEKARIHLERSMALYQPSHHKIMVNNSGENSCISSGCLLSFVLWLQGYPTQAVEVNQRTLALARQVNHPNSLGFALCVAAILNRWMKQIEESRLSAQEAIALAHEHGLPFWMGLGVASNGWVQATQGESAGIAQIQQCLNAANAIMSGTKVLFLALLSEAHVHLGQFEDALAVVNETLNVVDAKDDRFFESEFYRLKGECLLEVAATNMKQAEICFEQALVISRQQGAKSMELRAAMSMAQLWQRQGKQRNARQMLEEIYGWFTEGFDTFDLQETAKLLRTLA